MARVVLVEDEPWLGELYGRLLGDRHEVRWLRDGYAAMEEIDRQAPDVIVLDALLPRASGVQLLHELVSYTDTARIPVILFSTALPPELDMGALRAYGVVAVLDKLNARPAQVLRVVNGVAETYAQHPH